MSIETKLIGSEFDYPIKGLADLLALKAVCEEKIKILNEKRNVDTALSDSTAEFNSGNKNSFYERRHVKLVRLIEVIDQDVEKIVEHFAD